MVVRANGNAKRDQSLYLGTYSKISDYNGHSAYELDGKGQLYIYFYSSPVSKADLKQISLNIKKSLLEYL